MNLLASKCRHKNTVKSMNHKTTTKWKVSVFEAFFNGANVFDIWNEYGDSQSKSPYSRRIRVIRGRPTPNVKAFFVVDVRSLLFYFDTLVLYIYSYKLPQ